MTAGQPSPQGITRRQLVAGALAMVTLAACGSDDDGDAAQPAAGGEPGTEGGRWSFTDDLGVTVELDRRPERIVAQVSAAAALWDLGLRPVGVFGAARRPDGSPDQAAGDVDLDSVQVFGETFGEFPVETLAALRPDLVVTLTYEESIESATFDPYWYVPGEVLEQVEAVAPIVAIGITGRPIDHAIERFAELGRLLGADTDAAEVVADRERFDAAAQALRDASAAKPGLTAIFVSGTDESLYVAHPREAVDVWFYDDLGLDVVVPGSPPGEFWEQLSWEQADKYAVDLIFNDARAQAKTLDQLISDHPTFASLPAVRAGQAHLWYFEAPYSHRRYARVLEELAAAVRSADPAVA